MSQLVADLVRHCPELEGLLAHHPQQDTLDQGLFLREVMRFVLERTLQGSSDSAPARIMLFLDHRLTVAGREEQDLIVDSVLRPLWRSYPRWLPDSVQALLYPVLQSEFSRAGEVEVPVPAHWGDLRGFLALLLVLSPKLLLALALALWLGLVLGPV